MNLNPEFQRNLWLELTPHRLIMMPVVLCGIFFLTYFSSYRAPFEALSKVSTMIFLALTLFWGAKLATDAIVGEIRDNTWDNQRMSSISPWEMTWGKLFGATIYPWYGALFCICVYLYSAAFLTGKDFKHALLLVIVAILSQAIALLSSLLLIRKKRVYNRSSSSAIMLFAIVIGLTALSSEFTVGNGNTFWFGSSYESLNFIIVSSAIFLLWSLIGIHRLMRDELLFRNTPVVWMIFVIFISLYISGFINLSIAMAEPINSARIFSVYIIMLFLVYFMMFAEEKNPVTFRRIYYLARQKAWLKLMEEIPCWLATLFLLLIVFFILIMGNYSDIILPIGNTRLKILSLAAILFLLRDIGLIMYLNFGKNPQRADKAAVLYLVVLYGLIPAILSVINFGFGTALFIPWAGDYPLITVLSGGLQTGLIGWLIFDRWRRLYSSLLPTSVE